MADETMLFVDGENFTIRGQELAAQLGLALNDASYYEKDVFLWLADRRPGRFQYSSHFSWPVERVVRAYYYTSVVGDDNRLQDVRRRLRSLDFDPQVFKKDKGQAKSKGVDISLSRDMLSHAFHDHYETAILVAGDADYLPLVDEVKRFGKIVQVAFFEGNGLGLSDELKIRADSFRSLNDQFAQSWDRLRSR